MKNQDAVARKVIRYIEENIDRELNLDTISRDIGYSKFYLNRIFAEHTGITIYKYLRNRRLTVAAEKLVKSDKPILQIAHETGYDSQQSFSFAFRQAYLYPPKLYRDIGVFTPKQNGISMHAFSAPRRRKFDLRGIYQTHIRVFSSLSMRRKGAAA